MKRSRNETIDTRKRILAIASKMFMKDGLAETGIASIMAAAGLTQGGFYRHFRSKEQLIAEANITANDRMFDCFGTAVSGKSAREALDITVGLYLGQIDGPGCEGMCPLSNLGTELRLSDKMVRDTAMVGYRRLVEFFTELASRVGLADAEKLADAVVATLVGSVMLARLAASPESEQAILTNAKQTIQTMLAGAPLHAA